MADRNEESSTLKDHQKEIKRLEEAFFQKEIEHVELGETLQETDETLERHKADNDS